VGHPLRIVELATGDDQPNFIYLSACWGRDFALRLTRSNYSRLQKEITLDVLPKTIRDAILVARALHIPYIWVDSLCIFQDDYFDWEVEATRSKGYLESCTFTLGAASSPTLATGFLSFRDDQRCFTFNAQTVGSLPGAKVHLRPSLPPVWDSISRDPLLSRLWPLQELTICSRSILFGSSCIVWNCRTTMVSDASESDMSPIWNKHLGFDVLLGASATSESETSLVPSQNQDLKTDLSITSPSNSNESIYSAWHKIVEYSSRLKVTFEQDRLPALSALAAITGEKLHEDMYIAGLWRKNLHRDLLWHKADAPLKRTAGSTAPSWSWAAYAGRISYSVLHGEQHSETKFYKVSIGEADILNVEWQGMNPNPFGEVQSARIDIESLCIGYDELVKTMDSESRVESNITWLVQMDLSSETSTKDMQSSFESPEIEVEQNVAKEERGDEAAPQDEAIEAIGDQVARATDQEPIKSAVEIRQPSMRSHLTVVWISESRLDRWSFTNTLIVEPGEDLTSRRVGIGTLCFHGLDDFSCFNFERKRIQLA
jgi:Heterokaryon incompatibility protein (HET)